MPRNNAQASFRQKAVLQRLQALKKGQPKRTQRAATEPDIANLQLLENAVNDDVAATTRERDMPTPQNEAETSQKLELLFNARSADGSITEAKLETGEEPVLQIKRLLEQQEEVAARGIDFSALPLEELVDYFRPPACVAVSKAPPTTVVISTIPQGAIDELERRIQEAQPRSDRPKRRKWWCEQMNRALDDGGFRLQVVGEKSLARFSYHKGNNAIQLELTVGGTPSFPSSRIKLVPATHTPPCDAARWRRTRLSPPEMM